MPRAPEAVCLLGHHEPDYPRNRSLRKALAEAGHPVLEVHSRAPFPWRHFILGIGYLKIFRRVRWVLVTEGGHRLVPFIKLLAALTGRGVVFDPFLSRYNTRIEDRKLYRPGGLQALICRWQDWSSTHAADRLLFDTQEHRDYFFVHYHLRKPSLILPVGVPEEHFHPRPPASLPSPYPAGAPMFQVLFYGSYIPLQGVEWIVEAAAKLRGQDVAFTLIGSGQTRGQVEARARDLPRLRFLASVPEAELPAYLSHADLCLGIFGDTVKAANVVPNKVVQAAAMGKPLITRDSPAIRRYFSEGEDIALVPAADPQALADRILAIRNDPHLRSRLGAKARLAFESSFSTKALARLLGGFLGQS
jgi:glycosyltransferase involved in cell wall biosynthesis